jgi:vancomycin aglycone glucosyltransferase
LRAAINQGRAGLGLPAVLDALDHFAPPGCSVLATDAELAPAPADVHLREPPTGAMLLDEPGQLPDEVEAFLAAGPPPIYIGFGSMPDDRRDRTRQLLVKTVRASGCRALVYTSGPTSAGQRWSPEILTVGSLPHALLLPRVVLAVHHGGAGTSARAARAGIPQVILPHVLDQFPWSARIAERGLGPKPLLRHRPTARLLTARIRETLGDAGMRERAANLARELAARDGAAQAAEILAAD